MYLRFVLFHFRTALSTVRSYVRRMSTSELFPPLRHIMSYLNRGMQVAAEFYPTKIEKMSRQECGDDGDRDDGEDWRK